MSSVVRKPVIETVRLTKFYRTGFRMKRVRALVDLNLQVEKGEIFGFLGPNGAGKTTAIKIIIGLAKPTQGFATVLGKPPRDHRVKKSVGFLPESPYFYEYLTAAEFLELTAQLSGVPRGELKPRVREMLKMVRMEHAAHIQMKGFSRGMLQRIGIAQALIHDPEVVVLDEPMGGLDPIGRKEFRDIILSLRDQGKTVFFSTHILADVEMICDRVGIIVGGKMVKAGRLNEILTSEVEAIEVTVRGAQGKFRKALERVAQKAFDSGEFLMLTVKDDDDVERIMAITREAGAKVTAIVPRTKTLEDFFMSQVKSLLEERENV
ncbi:MAG: ABC transporter ATP-binding protein [candidate division WOR-3 bacterium]|jgi:ABC-2 type transport system ATP-binding protein|nr:ABC transporter ATP-binding protein [candidate division WOR-3 bacterium]MDH7518135.1 ABC transporter ATP-binding protein [bacterium]